MWKIASLRSPEPGSAQITNTCEYIVLKFLFADIHFDMPLVSPHTHPVILVAYILVAAMHIVSGLSLRACDQLLSSLRLLIKLMVEDFDTSQGRGKLLEKSIPMDARTILHRLALEPFYKAFVCYPECSTCYPDNGTGSYPEFCSSNHASTHASTQQTCGQSLRKSCNNGSRPYNTPVRLVSS